MKHLNYGADVVLLDEIEAEPTKADNEEYYAWMARKCMHGVLNEYAFTGGCEPCTKADQEALASEVF